MSGKSKTTEAIKIIEMKAIEEIKDSLEGKILLELLFRSDNPTTLKELREIVNDKKIDKCIRKLAKHGYIKIYNPFKGLTRKYVVLTDKGKDLAEKIAKYSEESSTSVEEEKS